MKRAVFLDRDGVLNRSILVNGMPTPPINLDQVEILDGVLEAIENFKARSFTPVVVTNQPDVSRQKVSEKMVQQINRKIAELTGIELFYTCFHDDSDLCSCRKPGIGLLKQAANDHKIQLSQSLMVGDRWRDIEAGQNAGCRCFFIDYSYPEKQPARPYTEVSSLQAVIEILLGEEHGTN